VVADALDRLGFRAQTLDPTIRPLYPGSRLIGRVVPVIIETTDRIPNQHYEGEIRAVEALSPGDVPLFLVPSGNRAALWGELFSCAGRGRGAVGAIVDGYVRDSRKIAELKFPVFCRGCSPLDTLGRAEVRAFGVEAVCGGVRILPNDYVIADEDGVVIIPATVFDDVVTLVVPKIRKESRARKDLLAGKRIRDVWKKYGVL
jgi:regulator of RNase E activity RraA